MHKSFIVGLWKKFPLKILFVVLCMVLILCLLEGSFGVLCCPRVSIMMIHGLCWGILTARYPLMIETVVPLSQILTWMISFHVSVFLGLRILFLWAVTSHGLMALLGLNWIGYGLTPYGATCFLIASWNSYILIPFLTIPQLLFPSPQNNLLQITPSSFSICGCPTQIS